MKRVRSASVSAPMCAPVGIRTFLSTIALRTMAPRPTTTPCIKTDPSTMAPASMVTPGEMMEFCTSPPEMMAPAQTIELTA